MTKILVDAITNIAIHNGILRIECTAIGPDGKQHPSGTLVIPGAVAGPVLQALINGTQELDKKLREQQMPPPPVMPDVTLRPYAQYLPVAPATFAHKRWRGHTGYRFAAGDAAVPLVGVELARAALAMPIAF